MTRHAFFIFLLFLSLLFESTIVSFPIVLIISILYFTLTQDVVSCVVIFIAAFCLDSLAITHFGTTMLYCVGILLFLQLYKRSFEVKDPIFLAVIEIINVAAFSYIVGYQLKIIWYVVLCMSAFIAAFILKKSHHLA